VCHNQTTSLWTGVGGDIKTVVINEGKRMELRNEETGTGL